MRHNLFLSIFLALLFNIVAPVIQAKDVLPSKIANPRDNNSPAIPKNSRQTVIEDSQTSGNDSSTTITKDSSQTVTVDIQPSVDNSSTTIDSSQTIIDDNPTIVDDSSASITKNSSQTVTDNTIQHQTVADPAYLRTTLPESAFIYLRVPNLWGLLGAPSGNIFDKLLRTEAHIKAILGIRSGIIEHFLPHVPADLQDTTKFFLAEIRSPLELAILAPTSAQAYGPSIPEVLLTVTFNQSEPAAINRALQALITQFPGVDLLVPLQKDGNGQLAAFGMPIQMYFDTTQRRLFLRLSLSNNAKSLQQRLAELTPTPNHPIHTVETSIDASGQGLLMWFSPAKLLKVAERLGRFKEVVMLRATGLAEAKAIALGMGGSGGKQRIKMLLDMPQVGLRKLLPGLHSDVPFMAAPGLDTVLMLGLPTEKDIAHFEDAIRPMMSTSNYQVYEAGKAQLEQATGLNIAQLAATFGGELLALHDQSGYYLALGVRDQTNYNTLLTNLVRTFKLQHETRELLGTKFHHLKIILPSEVDDPEMPGLLRTFVDQPTHVYWAEDSGYLLFSDVPQVPMNHIQASKTQSVANWLRDKQGVDPSGALLLASIRSEGVPQFLYHFHLWLLTYLGDLTNHPVDLFTFPSSRDLNLPKAGAYSVQFTSSPTQVALELVYESNPLDVLLTVGGLPTVAFAGIAASIAIPAFLASINEPKAVEVPPGTIKTIVAIRNQLEELYMLMEKYPSTFEADLLVDRLPMLPDATLNLEPDTGIVTINFSETSDHPGDLILVPSRTLQNNIEWTCQGSLATAMPAEVCPQ
ncbi:hypothetical protein TI05_00190 [Achromatium sp. WMS3]|nr:hypothetical protein TI05_00190 [Achromatium sp. WMS3]